MMHHDCRGGLLWLPQKVVRGLVPRHLSCIGKLDPWYRRRRLATCHLSLIEHRVRSHVRWLRGQHLFFAVDQVAGVESRDFEAVSVSNRIRGTRLDTVSTKDTSIVVDVIDLGVTLCSAYSMLVRILCRLDIDAVRRAGRRAQETGYAFFQSVFIALQDVNATKTLLELGAPKRPRPIGIVLHLRGLKHLHEGDAHALGDGRNVLKNSHIH